MWSKQGERTLSLNDARYNALCEQLEKAFIFDNKEKMANETIYTLKGNSNRMKALDTGWIKLYRIGTDVKLSYEISMRTTFIISIVMAVVLFAIKFFSTFNIFIALIPLFVIMLLLMLVSIITNAVFKSKIDKCVKQV